MHCETAQRALSASFDGAPRSPVLDRHQDGCRACRRYGEQLHRLRRAVRVQPVGAVPDVTESVMTRLRSHAAAAPATATTARGRRRRDVGPPAGSTRPRMWLSTAAVFIVGLLTGTTFVLGGRHDPAQAALTELVLRAQTTVETLQAQVRVTERGWRPEVPVRSYSGELGFQAPERWWIDLRDRTDYPSATRTPNDVVSVVADDVEWSRGPVACAGTTGDCGRIRTAALTGRPPFEDAAASPLDLVVPVRSFGAVAPAPLGRATVTGREAIGVSTTVAAVRPLLDALTTTGNWRDLHPTDRVELWLDADALVPLALDVTAADSAQRALWAARQGYADAAGEALFTVRLQDLRLNRPLTSGPPPLPADAIRRDAGFTDTAPPDTAVPVPGWLPPGMQPHRAGLLRGGGPEVAVAAWSDGRAWVTVRATRQWTPDRLFGPLGEAPRPVSLAGGGTAYVALDGTAVALHGPDRDVAVEGTVGADALLRIAASLGLEDTRPVPRTWREAGWRPLEAVVRDRPGVLAAFVLPGFGTPAARLDGDRVVVVYPGTGGRTLVLTAFAGDGLSPPLDAAVVPVEVRSQPGRYTPSMGELEWTEAGAVYSLRSATASMTELVQLAAALTVGGGQ